ncbi:uncharacterized protein TrAtP1_005476 [Trichoderma atroviride]|uniref:uncharacterized protein n=1 Tax=Hypocrea atroviridis TaxID=63577 RepID=UPI0033238210|nr:hypothetical protein TrAtP1_005476 [Trichoderma atroviride]
MVDERDGTASSENNQAFGILQRGHQLTLLERKHGRALLTMPSSRLIHVSHAMCRRVKPPVFTVFLAIEAFYYK